MSIPQCIILEFRDTLSSQRQHIRFSMSIYGNSSGILHCGIVVNMPYNNDMCFYLEPSFFTPSFQGVLLLSIFCNVVVSHVTLSYTQGSGSPRVITCISKHYIDTLRSSLQTLPTISLYMRIKLSGPM